MRPDDEFMVDFGSHPDELIPTSEMLQEDLGLWRAEQDAKDATQLELIHEMRANLDDETDLTGQAVVQLDRAEPTAVDSSEPPVWNWDDHRDNLPDAEHEKAVAAAVKRMVIQEEARRAFSALHSSPHPFDAGTLAEITARGPEPQQRIDGLMPFESNLMIIATKKTGKTTCILDMARSFVTGGKLFGKLDVRPIENDAKVGILNYEVAAKTLARWATEVGIPADRLFIVNLRGRRNPLRSEDERARLGDLLREQRVEVLIVDVFTRAFTGDDQSNNSQTQVFFDELEQWAREDVGVTELIVTAHAGKVGDSFRGASQPEGWADVNVYLTRDSDAPTARRHIAAEGRDVALDKTPLDYDVATRQFTLGSATSAMTTHTATLEVIERLLTAAAVPMNSSAVEDALDATYARDIVRKALKFGVESGRLSWTPGPRNSKVWAVAK